MEISLKANIKKGRNESDSYDIPIYSQKSDEFQILPRASGNIYSYTITIKTAEKMTDPKLIFNGFEIIELINNGSDPNVWQTKSLKALEYFAFNLGIVSLDLEYDEKIHSRRPQGTYAL